MKDKVKPIYSELQGMLSQAPESSKSTQISDQQVWTKYNSLIDELKTVTGDNNYETSKVEVLFESWQNGGGKSYVKTNTFRSLLGGLISRLHGTYFTNENAPFSGSPGIAINNNQTTNVAISIQLGIDLQKAKEKAETQEEKNFIDTLIDKAATGKTYIEFVVLVINLAQQFGVTPDKILKLFGH